jgi:hypothetical protein
VKALLRTSYTAPASLAACLILLLGFPHPASAQGGFTISTTQTFCTSTNPCVATYHNDVSRDGVNQNETTLTPKYVKSHTFGTTTVSTDGLIYAQPLYIHGLYGAGSGNVGSCTATKQSPVNVVFVATENNSVYAFDTSGNKCWQAALDRSAPAESAVGLGNFQLDVNSNPVTDLVPQSGITGTPVIDINVTPPILYVVTAHQINNGGFDHVIHAIDATTGSEVVTGQSIGVKLGTNFYSIAQRA